ncbi:YesL family protein [Sporosarcina sp. NPDC096371]|uniref:YesL family protein n=1 Tax=Sporosarcina sp. NPDC096371 TaxID=3364530 RepID=UPI00381AF0CD
MIGWEKFNRIAYRMIELAYINILWLLFTLIGLVAFGVFPATTAMFTVIRKLIKKEENFKIYPTFWQSFRSDFFKANGFGLIFIVIAYFFYFDFYFLQLNSGKLEFLFPILIFIMISGIVTLLFFFPVYTHFNLRFFQYFKQSFFIAITSPVEVIAIGTLAVFIYFVATIFPGIIPLFTGSVFAYAATLFSYRAFSRIEKRQNVQL